MPSLTHQYSRPIHALTTLLRYQFIQKKMNLSLPTTTTTTAAAAAAAATNCFHMIQLMPLPFPNPIDLLPHLNPDWLYLSRTSLPWWFWKRGR